MLSRPQSFLFAVADLAVAGLLVWSSWPHSRNYYILLRFGVCVVAGVELYIRRDLWPAVILIGAIIVVFNPLIPLSFAKSTWTKIDLVIAVLFVFAAIAHLPIRDSMLSGTFLLALSGLLIVFGAYGIVSAVRLSNGRQTEGEVIEVTQDTADRDNGPSEIIYTATYRFVLPSGQVVLGASDYGGAVGDKVSVFYNPNNPHENRLANDTQKTVRGSVVNLVIILIVAWAIGSVGISKLRARNAS